MSRQDDGESLEITGWETLDLSELAEVRLGRQRSPKRARGKHMRPYMRAANVTWNEIILDDVKEMDFTPSEFEVYKLRPGDILLSEASGSSRQVGKSAIWENQLPGACFQNTLIRVRPPRSFSAYLQKHFLFDALSGRFADASRGVGIHHLGARTLAAWQVKIPPQAEQDRIVEALDFHLSRLDAAAQGLKRLDANLERYRASVLQAAVKGRLVPTEATLAQKEERDYEPATVLLERILEERRQRWETAELSRMKAKDREPKNDRWKRRYKEPVVLDTSELPELPPGWCWSTVDQVAEVKGGIQKGKKRKPGQVLRTVPYLRVANVQRGFLDLTEVKKTAATEAEIELLRLLPGDVLFNEGGDRDQLGRGWVWSRELPECIHQNHIFRARIFTSDLCPKFLSWYGNSIGQQYFFDEGKQTTNLASLNATKLRSLPIPIPPRLEQDRIQKETERLLSIAKTNQEALSEAVRHLNRLRLSILRWAFEGNLVDQDPEDEPASELLERIRRKRKEAETSRKKEKSSSKSQLALQIMKIEPRHLEFTKRPEARIEEIFERSGFDAAVITDIETFYDLVRQETAAGRATEAKRETDADGLPIIRLRNLA